MNKRIGAVFASLGLLSASFSFASQPNLNGYYSSQHPSTTVSKAAMVFPTSITIFNSSSDPMFVEVPNTPIHDYVSPGNTDHIHHDSYYGDTHLVLRDVYYPNVFFDNYVC